MKLLVATSNQGKVVEIIHEIKAAGLEARGVQVVGLRDLAGYADWPEVEEDQPTFEGNAAKKARHYAQLSGLLTLADDSGLCVAALDGAPGVRSARYAGEPCDNAANNAKLLREMADIAAGRRAAKFVCAMALAAPRAGGAQVAEGAGGGRGGGGEAEDLAVMTDEVHGEILGEARGRNGFGYDPLFFHPASGKTTAELTMEEKSKLSHRGKALRKMIAWMGAHWDGLEHGRIAALGARSGAAPEARSAS